MVLPVALDAMGGDRAPDDIVAGAQLASEKHNVPVVLVGNPDVLGDTGGLEVIAASETISMDEEPGSAVRNKKDSSLVVAAEAVRDGKASSMVSAGNTGAAMASALLRFGRLPNVARPAIATPIPVPGSTPTVLLDAGANADCQSQWLVQFARMGAVFSRVRFGVDNPRVALLSIGEEDEKGSQLVKETHKALRAEEALNFIGNVEGRDFLRPSADVVVTDGFTGNVVLKTLEGGVGYMVEQFKKIAQGLSGPNDEASAASGNIVQSGKLASMATDETRAGLSATVGPLLKELDPNTYGGAMLLGVDGVCIISHGSSSSDAICNAIGVAHSMSEARVVDELRAAVSPNQ